MASPAPALLVLSDSITTQTGFARVATNLVRRWLPHFDRIDQWAIGYNGWPHFPDWWPADARHRLYPGGLHWDAPDKLEKILQVLHDGYYTHLWMMQDPFRFHYCSANFTEILRQVLDKRNIRFLYYCPIDCDHVEPEWLKIINTADVPVAYTCFGREAILRAVTPAIGLQNPIRVLPHGCETDVYHPLEHRAKLRHDTLQGWAEDGDIVLLNVNAAHRRKAHWNCLQLLAALKQRSLEQQGPPIKLVMHVPEPPPGEQIALLKIADQLGLTRKDWLWTCHAFVKGHATLSEEGLNRLYNCADYVISTSLGEGWGFSISEGLAAGVRVAAPNHTSVREIMDELSDMGHADRFVRLPLSTTAVVLPQELSRVRWPIDVGESARALYDDIVESRHMVRGDFRVSEAARQWLSWDRIADEWLKLMFP
jgi:glycosyltransferase involved in cell wall biosynthesis